MICVEEPMPSQTELLAARYQRICAQLEELFTATPDPLARMATAAALLHHKQPHFFWTGFYRHSGGQLTVGPYQGPLACQVLTPGQGVCWACVERRASILVPDVHAFPGPIACDARSQSEVVVPVFNGDELAAVLDVDSDVPAAFTETDQAGLERVAALIYV
jgi:GAF domain-containing protein